MGKSQPHLSFTIGKLNINYMKHWISPDIKYKTFKLLNDKLSPQDLAPKNHNKIMWEMIRDRKINCFIDDMSKEDAVFFTLKDIPKNARIISSPSK